jgi:hypothetical protein
MTFDKNPPSSELHALFVKFATLAENDHLVERMVRPKSKRQHDNRPNKVIYRRITPLDL